MKRHYLLSRRKLPKRGDRKSSVTVASRLSRCINFGKRARLEIRHRECMHFQVQLAPLQWRTCQQLFSCTWADGWFFCSCIRFVDSLWAGHAQICSLRKQATVFCAFYLSAAICWHLAPNFSLPKQRALIWITPHYSWLLDLPLCHFHPHAGVSLASKCARQQIYSCIVLILGKFDGRQAVRAQSTEHSRLITRVTNRLLLLLNQESDFWN